MMIRLLIADDHAVVREGLRRIVESTDDMTVIGEAADGFEAVERARAAKPDVMLLDITMPGKGGLETLKDLKRENLAGSVLFLTVHPEDRFAVRCLKEGADGYLTKDRAPETLLEAIRKVYGGGKYVSTTLAERLAFTLDSTSERPRHESLSDREYQVLCMIAGGKMVKQISQDLELSVKTVSTYRARILEKLEMKSNAEMVRYAIEQGLVT